MKWKVNYKIKALEITIPLKSNFCQSFKRQLRPWIDFGCRRNACPALNAVCRTHTHRKLSVQSNWKLNRVRFESRSESAGIPEQYFYSFIWRQVVVIKLGRKDPGRKSDRDLSPCHNEPRCPKVKVLHTIYLFFRSEFVFRKSYRFFCLKKNRQQKNPWFYLH